MKHTGKGGKHLAWERGAFQALSALPYQQSSSGDPRRKPLAPPIKREADAQRA